MGKKEIILSGGNVQFPLVAQNRALYRNCTYCVLWQSFKKARPFYLIKNKLFFAWVWTPFASFFKTA